MRASLLVLGVALAACGAPAPVRPAGAPRPAITPPSAPGLALRYALTTTESTLVVQIDATGGPEALSDWSLALAADVVLAELVVETAEGVVAGAAPAAGAPARLHLERPGHHVRIRYALTPPYARLDDPSAIALSPRLLRFPAHAAFFVPERPASWAVTVTGHLEGSPAPVVLSTVSASGALPAALTSAQLADTVFVVAPQATEIRFRTTTAEDEFAIVEPAALDYRIAMGEVAVAREAVANYFLRKDLLPRHYVVTPLFAAQPTVRIQRGTGGMVLQVPVDAPWRNVDTLDVATAFVAETMNAEAASPDDRAVVAGVARYVARAVLLDVGLLAPSEAAADLNDTLHTLVAAESQPRALTADEQRAVRTARGDLWATWVDGERAAGAGGAGGGRSAVAEAITRWAARGKDDPRARGVAGLVEAAGPNAQVRYAEQVDKGTVKSPPRVAYGRCFEVRPRDFGVDERGYELDAERRHVAAVAAGSPAARAGLAIGDEVVRASVTHEPGVKERTVILQLRRGSLTTEVRFTPRQRRIVRPGWAADDAKCRSLP